ncbi:carbohydrate ABC transporter permease [Cohnella thailandensis]|uniref:Sugar ABC transporter permease n=1 Tax=Cohnella thailandensis TaxID=557557 RepID=A0A841T0G3_9BACL|nr:sugar ABC transporter permease [Cohnella thailandensis]MBB6634531.1 sugar ABC transporter permease [Cohnella thailandensis]MBP1972915.1 multiple sugar transport system permease protein [Cohnella thailandensis]
MIRAGRKGFGRRMDRWAPIVFTAPTLLFIVALMVFPFLYSVYLSLLKYKLTLPAASIHFTGFDNYRYMLDNASFLRAAQWTFVFSVIAVAAEVILGMIMALTLNSNAFGKRTAVFKSLFIMPLMLAPIVSAKIWSLLFQVIYGPINYVLSSLGFDRVSWSGEPLPAKLSIILVDIWQSAPFCMLILLAALKTVPKELTEAAAIDGAGRIGSFFKITLPLIRHFLALVVSIRIMDALRVFDSVVALTNGAPGDTTETLATITYKTAFRYADIGAGSAGSILYFLFIVVFSLLAFVFMRRKDPA